jgi:glycosyltransferase involved in cell wall biosynthesis
MRNFNESRVVGVEGVPDYSARSYSFKENNTALLIPIINEGTRILQQLKNLNAFDLKVDIVIADGGSSDHTKENIEDNQLNIRAFLVKDGPGGLSAQLRMGFHYCLSEEYDSVITMDGNNKDDPKGLEHILSAIESDSDFVQGSRFISGGKAVNTPIKRLIAIRFIHAPLTSFAARHWYTDTTNGFRGHSAKLLKHPEVKIFRDVFDSYELLAYLPIRSKQIGLRVKEVPVTRSYPKGVKTPTKIHGIKDQTKLLKILFEGIVGRYNPK